MDHAEALWVACARGKEDEVRSLLLRQNASVDYVGQSKMSTLIVAIKRHLLSDDTVRMLFEASDPRSPSAVDVNHKDAQGFTALHWAAWNKNAAICSLLMEHGANMHVENKYRKTPLDLAAKENAQVPRESPEGHTYAVLCSYRGSGSSGAGRGEVFVHVGVKCSGCASSTALMETSISKGFNSTADGFCVRGPRYRSAKDTSFSLCTSCEDSPQFQHKAPFLKIKNPADADDFAGELPLQSPMGSRPSSPAGGSARLARRGSSNASFVTGARAVPVATSSAAPRLVPRVSGMSSFSAATSDDASAIERRARLRVDVAAPASGSGRRLVSPVHRPTAKDPRVGRIENKLVAVRVIHRSVSQSFARFRKTARDTSELESLMVAIEDVTEAYTRALNSIFGAKDTVLPTDLDALDARFQTLTKRALGATRRGSSSSSGFGDPS